ncbi:MAG: tRNA pseudouridine(55) synthase TruB [Candidatus Eisenbacteria bacterium]|nr:tRNA pseudouridine(55) synthase TruB [Candidatus Eisenbacteria bacterium]
MTGAPVRPARPARPAPLEWAGLLPVDKPGGMTSHDVVSRARRVLGTRAIGHLGTLDPGASGLLVLAVGPATRCAQVWQGGAKTYAATVRFGVVTSSQDLDGDVLETRDVTADEAAVRRASDAMLGDSAQVPPMVSALKHKGERLYDIARRGEVVEREPRPITVHAWDWTRFAMPDADCVVRCSGGTYVRTLAHDLGASLGCGAALASLRRLASEPFRVEDACPWEAFVPGDRDALIARWGVTLDRALGVLPEVRLDAAQADALGHGQFVEVAPDAAAVAAIGAGPRTVALRELSGRALALGELVREADGRVLARPNVVFPWAVREGRAA